MTTAFQASIKYPLIWIINTANPGESEPIANKVHRKIKKMVRFTDWLRAHYETAYHYYLAEHLHEYGIGTGEIHDFLGLRVTGAKTLHISLYRKSWSEVYVDVIIRAYVDIFTGNESTPNRRKSVIDYRVRGYYDLYEKRCHLFQCFMPYRPEDDMDKLRLDDYLVPIIGKNDLEDEPYYPVNDEKNGALYAQYKALAEKEKKVIFGGRLGEYKYYDMDAVIASALELCKKEL